MLACVRENSDVMYIEALTATLAAQLELVQRIDAADLSRPSDCDGWSVGDVLNHSVGVTRKFAWFARGQTDAPLTPVGDLLGADHSEAVRSTVDTARAAWPEIDPNRTCRLPFGEFTASQVAGINLFDALAHCWDVAGPTNNSFTVPDELWVRGLAAAETVIGRNRDPSHYGPMVVSRTASPRDRFLAYLGRSPHT